MNLSNRATAFLRKSERESVSISLDKIKEIFESNSAPLSEPLLEFQVKYGGFIFYAGLAPIKFSLLKGLGGYPESNYSAVVEFEETRLSSPKYFFDCATTDYQMQYFLDEKGVYYEDYEAKATSFDKLVENLAIWEEISSHKKYELLFRDKAIDYPNIDSILKLDLLEEASDMFTQWYSNEYIYLRQRKGLTTLVVSDNYPDKLKLLML